MHILSHWCLNSKSKFIMFSLTLLIIYLFNSFNLEFASSKLPEKLPPGLFKKTSDGIIFSAPLIHRSSKESPFFNPNYTREEHIEDGVLTSLARARYFSQSKATSKDYVAAPVSGGSMLMKYTIGTPPVDSYGIFDTGSSFTWFQCLPCIQCYNQASSPLFNPEHSSSYQQVLCFDPDCHVAPGWTCGSSFAEDPDLCLYHVAYLDNTTSRGIVSAETLTLTAENTSRTVENMIFGCGNDNQDDSGIPGIVGVGNLSSSLLHQLSVSHFSHYIFANRTDIHGVVHFGPGASMSDFGMTTPLLPSDNGVYYLNLVGISVDGSDLDFPDGIFEKGTEDDGIDKGFIIDSGCSYTLLRSEAFDVLKSAITDAMFEQTPESTARFEVCYRDVSAAPEVVFQFSGLDYILCDANLWVRRSGLYCLAMIRLKESEGKVSILGFHQQRNVQVGYDLENNLLSLVYPGACPDYAVDFLQ